MAKRLHSIAGMVVIALPACPAVASAANEAPNQSQTEAVIVVTGERIPRSFEQTASSVAFTSAHDLERMPDISHLDQLLEMTPNLVLGSGGQGPTIRGQDTTGVLRDLPAFLGGNRPRTTVVIDGRSTSYNEFVFGSQPLWDVDRVEIFRSPQTTTQGRNSIAGAIFIETQLPENEWGGRARAITGSSDTRQISGMLAGPIVEEQLAVRIVGDVREKRTFSDLTSPAVGVDPNRDWHELFRAKILATPASIPELRLDATFQTSKSQAPQIEGIRPPYRERNDPRAGYGVFRVSTESLTLRSQLQLDRGMELSATLSGGSSNARRFAPAGIGEALTDTDDQAVEILLKRNRGRLDMLVGASASRTKLTQAIDLSTVGLGVGNFRDRQDSLGLFGEISLALAPRLNLTTGARYQSDRQLRSGTLANTFDFTPYDFDGRFSSFSPKASLTYGVGEGTTIGALLQRAANPGGATLSPSTGLLDTFAAEHLWDYEIFLRGKLPSANLEYSANLFYYDMFNAQRSALKVIETPGGSFFLLEIGNMPRSWSKGAEFALGWSPGDRLNIRLAAGLLKTRITEAPLDRDPLLGKEFQRSPRFTGSAAIDWRPSDKLSLGLSYSRRSGYFSEDNNDASLRVGSADTVNARLEWRQANWRWFGFVRNVFDRFNLTSLSSGGDLATAASPRELGGGLEFQF
ncbi:TonB-dependent receptor [Altererythrobacter sp. Z27]|uniref:TonB-dependent receptor n=1 Tax=Altererythrobacter sp. Z27 TaxID=3461147 RepID=UPI004044A03C